MIHFVARGRLTLIECSFLIVVVIWLMALMAAKLGVELESWKAQNRAVLAFWLVPFGLWVLAVKIRPSRWRTICLNVVAILSLISILPAGCSWLDVRHEHEGTVNFSFEPLHRQVFGGGDIVLYRTNCGATCSFGLVLRQERLLVSGLKLTRVIGRWYPADMASIQSVLPDIVRVEVAPYGEKRSAPIVEDIVLSRSFVWQ